MKDTPNLRHLLEHWSLDLFILGFCGQCRFQRLAPSLSWNGGTLKTYLNLEGRVNNSRGVFTLKKLAQCKTRHEFHPTAFTVWLSAFLLYQKCLWRTGLLLFGSTWKKLPSVICSGPSGKCLAVLDWKTEKYFAEGHWDVKSVQQQSVSLSLILKTCQASLKRKALWTVLKMLNYEGASKGIFWVCVDKS